MRDLFLTGARLIGIYYLVSTIIEFPMLKYYLERLFDLDFYTFEIEMILQMVLKLVFAYILLFKPHKIANLIKLKTEDASVLSIDKSILLRVGITIVGVFLFMYNLSIIPGILFQYYYRLGSGIYWHSFFKLLSDIFIMIVPITIALASNKIAGFIERFHSD